MPYTPLENICKYYTDCIIEDTTDNISAFEDSTHPKYILLNEPEWSTRNPLNLTENELNNFRSTLNYQTRGRQQKTWWYGYPISFITIKSNKSNWQGKIIKPIFYLPIEITPDFIPIINNLFPRLNFEALKDWDIEIQEAKKLGENLGLFNDTGYIPSFLEITNGLKDHYPDLPYNANSNQEKGIILKGAFFCTESSPFTQGVEAELNKLKNADKNVINKTALKVFFPEVIDKQINQVINKEELIYEIFDLNDEQKNVLKSVFSNDLTVVTGPPGTGKSQVVASIIVNAARKGQRVLFASKNHKAVDVVEDRLNQFTDRPFIIRLGSKGSDDRNIRQELIQYLTSLLGTTADPLLQNQLYEIQQEISGLVKKRNEILSKVEQYRNERIKLNGLNQEYMTKVIDKIGEMGANKLIEWAKQKRSFIITLLSKLSTTKRITLKYSHVLNSIQDIPDIESLCEKLDELTNKIHVRSQKEFKLWLDTLPLRIDSQKRRKLTEYTSVLRQIIESGTGTSSRDWAQLYSKRESLMREISGFLPAWCVANLSAKGSLPYVDGFFDVLIIDEASQCDIPSALPLMYRAKKAVVIGDPNQLQHITGINLARSLTLMNQYNLSDTSNSIFEYTGNSLFHCSVGRIGENNITMLREHFRSHSDIISFSNQKWYNNALTVETDYRRLISDDNDNTPKVIWVNTEGRIQQHQGTGGFIAEECDKVVEITRSLLNNENFKGEIGIVTPFRLQANRIREKLIKEINENDWTRTNLLVNTTVKFQGDERDIMIFSPVVAPNMPRGIRYYHETTPNLFNVSITRARSKLIVVGNNIACINSGITLIRDFANYVNGLTGKRNKSFNQNLQFETPEEKILYEALMNNNIKTIPQYEIDQYRMDLAYINGNKKIDIEVDGKQFHTDWRGEVLKKDIIRNQRLQKLGWKVLRFWVYEIRDNLNYCISKIQKEL